MSGITAVRWYRNPDLATDSLGRAQITFYNNSTATRLRVDAATLSPEGVIGVDFFSCQKKPVVEIFLFSE